MDPRIFTLKRKIDFSAGAHGNFLELLLYIYACQGHITPNQPLFDENGACHLKYYYLVENKYPSPISCHHYSTMNLEFNEDDRVIEISVKDDYKIAVVINSDLRSGNQKTDIYHPEVDTLEKFSRTPKKQGWIDILVKWHGQQKNYPRSSFRHLYYGYYANASNINKFSFTGNKINFPHSCFFDFPQLCQNLKKAADFFDLDFRYDESLEKIWQQFIDLNQGYRAKLKCDQILASIRKKEDVSLEGLSVPEESWIIFQLFPPGDSRAHEYLENFPASTGSILTGR